MRTLVSPIRGAAVARPAARRCSGRMASPAVRVSASIVVETDESLWVKQRVNPIRPKFITKTLTNHIHGFTTTTGPNPYRETISGVGTDFTRDVRAERVVALRPNVDKGSVGY